MKIIPYTPDWEAAWRARVAVDPDSKPFHRRAWARVIASGYGFEEVSLVASAGRDLVGLLPLYQVGRPLGRPILVSAPMATAAGPLADDAAIRAELLEEAHRLAMARRVAYLEIRQGAGRAGGSVGKIRPGWHALDHYASFRKTLPGAVEDVLAMIPRKQRAEVRKARADGMIIARDRDLVRFYALYRRSVQRLGSPVFPEAYARALVEAFGEACEILTVERDGMALASLLTLYHGGWAYPYHAGGRLGNAGRGAYPALYAAAMERAVGRGVHGFDFGRSIVGTGAHAFKKNFGFEPEPMGYSVALVANRNLPDLRPDNPRLKPIVAVWKRLPAPVADRLGPWVSRQIV